MAPQRQPPPRVILHLDMDAFFAAIEARDDPSLKGVPLIIGRRGARGVVATCSYEARAFGVRSAMPSVTAERLCPDAVWLPPRGALYDEVSDAIAAILDDISPLVERVSIDEAFLDLTGIARDLPHGARIASTIKERVREQERLSCSVGVSFNRILAKMGSDLEKPDGLVIIAPEDVATRVHPLPVRKLWGVGPRGEEKLKEIGVRAVGDLLRVPEGTLVRALGAASAQHLLKLARGEDDSPVTPDRERKSISDEETYLEDLTERKDIERELLEKAEAVAYALRLRGLSGRTVHLKARTGDYTTWTRSKTLARPTDLAEQIFRSALELLDERVDTKGKGLRLLGVGVSHLGPSGGGQLEMFGEEDAARKLAIAADAVRGKFGRKAITRARLMEKPARGGHGGPSQERDDP